MLARLETEETEVRPVLDLVDLPVALVDYQATMQPEDSLVQPDDSLEYEIPLPVRPAAAKAPAKKRGWGRFVLVATLLALTAGGIFAVMGGAGAVLVAGGAIAGWMLYTVPVIDIQMPQAQPLPPPVVLPAPPANQGESDADLIVMPDPGFRQPNGPAGPNAPGPRDPVQQPGKPLKSKLP